MTINEAKKLLLSQEIKLMTASDHDHYKAILLGAQALERITEYRKGKAPYGFRLLPGETEE